MIYFILWISGSWKSTLIKNIKKINLSNLAYPLSYKTREKRDFEIDWIDAYFLSKEDFLNWINAWEFLEYALVHGDEYYWTKWKDIEKELNLWKNVIKELDLNWLISLKKNRKDLEYKTIFLDLPINKLEERILKRQTNIDKKELEIRLQNAFTEEENLRKICDFNIDSTKTEEEILKEVLKIINKNNWIFDSLWINFLDNLWNSFSGMDFSVIFDDRWEIIIEVTKSTWEVIWNIVWWIFSNIDL